MANNPDRPGLKTLWAYIKEIGRELKRPAAWFFIIIALVLATKSLEVIRTHRGQPPLFGEIFQPVLRAIGGFVADPDAIDRYLRRIPAFIYQIVIPFSALWFWFILTGWKKSGGHLVRALREGFSVAWNGFGLSLRCIRDWWKTLLLIFCVMLPFIYAFATTESFRRHYPYLQRLRLERTELAKIDKGISEQTRLIASSASGIQTRQDDNARVELDKLEARARSVFWGSLGLLLLFELLRMLYMVSWEFFFRGFMLQGLLRLGLDWHAVWIQMLPYVMLHSTKPGIELYYTIPSGVLLGVLAWKTGSIWPGFLLHFIGAVVFDVFAMFA